MKKLKAFHINGIHLEKYEDTSKTVHIIPEAKKKDPKTGSSLRRPCGGNKTREKKREEKRENNKSSIKFLKKKVKQLEKDAARNGATSRKNSQADTQEVVFCAPLYIGTDRNEMRWGGKEPWD